MEYIVAKNRISHNKKMYVQGEKVELSEKEALFLIERGIVIPIVDTKLPSESDGLFAELQKKVTDLEKIIEQQKGMIANFTRELETKNLKIAEFDAKKRR